MALTCGDLLLRKHDCACSAKGDWAWCDCFFNAIDSEASLLLPMTGGNLCAYEFRAETFGSHPLQAGHGA